MLHLKVTIIRLHRESRDFTKLKSKGINDHSMHYFCTICRPLRSEVVTIVNAPLVQYIMSVAPVLILKFSVGYEVFLFILIPKIILVVIVKVSFHPNHKSMSLFLHNCSLLHTLIMLFLVLVFFQFLYEWKSLYLSTTPGNAVDFFDSSTHRCQGMGVIIPSCAMMSVY